MSAEDHDAGQPRSDAGVAEDAGGFDAGLADAGAVDAGAVDAGDVDAGDVDAGEVDAGGADAGGLDAGDLDAGEPDAGLVDAGAPDAGDVDAGAPDAGLPDAGAPDAGPVVDDAGTPDAGIVTLDAGDPDAGPVVEPDAGVVALTCTSCHGSTNPAPPFDTHGGTSTSLRTVGAHQAHLRAGSWYRPIECAECHQVPATIEAPGHLDAPPAELTFGVVANASGVSSQFDGASCSTYCHGATLAGGTSPTPSWTLGAAMGCDSCHGYPPHPQFNGWCGTCHPSPFTEPQKHIDGHLDVATTCSSCHGDATSPAPPKDTSGRTSTSARTVGAHRSHLGPSTWHAEVTCEDCHTVPTRVDDPGHLDPAPAELHFGPLAQSRGVTPTWTGATCSNYCHGATLDGGFNPQPTWTRVDGTEAACGACHGLPPPAPHPQNAQCSVCHGAVVDANRQFVDPALHIDGQVEALVACGSCHELPPRTGTHLLHASDAGARAYGSLLTAASLATPQGYAFGCGYCHPLDPSHHMSGGLADIELYDPTAPPGSLKARSPLATYTRGPQQLVDAVSGIAYTQGTCGSVYCHSGPAYTSRGPVPQPGVDFTFAGYPISYPAFALDVTRDYRTVTWGGSGSGCSGCHGFPIRTAEPAVHAAVGQSHSFVDDQGWEYGHAFNHGDEPLPCRTCHADTVTAANATSRAGGLTAYGPVPITGWARHINGLPDVAFDTVDPVSSGGRLQSLGTATYSQASSTCFNVACHKAQTAVKSGQPFRPETNVYECNVCHQY